MSRMFCFFAVLPLWCNATELPSRCGTLPLASEDQAICAATHYLQVKSKVCIGGAGFSFSAQATGSSWVVQVHPKNWQSTPECTGDRLEISQKTGLLIKWQQLNYQP